jgi:hypothetical protein
MRPKALHLPTPEQLILEEIATLRAKADAAASSANALTTLILNHKAAMASDVTILQETATLLQHTAQNFLHVLSLRSTPPTAAPARHK